MHLQLGVRSQSSVLVDEDKAVSSMLPAVAALSVASLGTSSLVVWGRLVCFCLKFPNLEFDVKAGLLVGRLAGRLSLHKCTGWQLP